MNECIGNGQKWLRLKNGLICRWVHVITECIVGHTDFWVVINGWTDAQGVDEGWMSWWMDGWVDGRVGGWMGGWMDGWVDGRVGTC